MDLSTEWAGQSSEDHRATVLLRQEHEMLLDLFRRQHEPALEPPVSRDWLQEQILALLDLIDRMERDVFFPALPPEFTALIRAFKTDHDGLARCVNGLRRAAANAARASVNSERLEQLARDHVAQEETLLFTAVEREHPDLNRTLYDRLVVARERLARQPEGAMHA
jgi:hypothetical protein